MPCFGGCCRSVARRATTRERSVMMIARTLALPLFLLAGPALAAPSPQWTVDTTKSTLGFSGTQTGARFTGRFNRYKAAIAFDPDHLEASRITVAIDLGSAATGDTQRDTALPGKDWFDIAHFPEARFASTAIQRKGGSAYVAIGNLTLHGVTRAVALPFTLVIRGDTAHAKGHVQLETRKNR
ncbi:polyisoprenoid-binding protein [Sphingobium yanoikuyae]|uniref:Polyisoprenoid-binding protein n=2 Tax=Sphingobium yanoikuyae TaxID=13690 RepID=A0A430BRI4_SPHYA|nr:polyisoprenoid-binding protein [Sphingobium yanoikuyae]